MLGVVILAGGAATRLRNKLERPLGGEPVLLRVFRNLRQAGPTYVLANRTFAPPIDLALTCPVIIDRRPERGPLTALHDALPLIAERHVFVVSADLPFVHAAVAEELWTQLRPGDDAVVPADAHGIAQPLCALYDRIALLDAAGRALESGKTSMNAALERLNVRRVHVRDALALRGVNTPEEFLALRTIDLGIRARA